MPTLWRDRHSAVPTSSPGPLCTQRARLGGAISAHLDARVHPRGQISMTSSRPVGSECYRTAVRRHCLRGFSELNV